ncbi:MULTISPECIES: hypothetical protein [unclassified Bradyrhizobium]|uniref:hypothetical protein n=1 Tax=unclassified Bradyrhizobium TaxID=2631580 RepID=UPI002FEF89BC
MIAVIFIGLAAGCASALMFVSTISGAPISLLLSLFAPLPLMVTALSWGPLSATIGGIAAASGFGALIGLPHCLAFAVAVALPAWWLGHLALLGRPTAAVEADNGTHPAAENLEWYPIGRILLWIVGFAVMSSIASWLVFGKDADAIAAALRSGLTKALSGREGLSPSDIERLADTLVTIFRGLSAMLVVTTLTLNLWLAAKISAMSGRFRRPWPDLKNTALPPMTLVALCGTLAFCFAGGAFSIAAQIMTAALFMAYALVGLAAVHTLTLALKSRAVLLSCTYGILVLLPWTVVLMIALGLTEEIFGLRQRYLRRKPPPLPAA